MDSPWLKALRHPLTLAMLPLSLVAGLCAATWLLPVGLGLWALMVVITVRDSAPAVEDEPWRRG
jgi:hypothetical protein